MDNNSKSLKQAINIVLLSRFMSKELSKLDFACLQGSDMSYFTYSKILKKMHIL